MKRLVLIAALTLFSTGIWANFSCPGGTSAVCMENGDSICPGTAKCVSNDVMCFAKDTCAAGEKLICESRYDVLMRDYKGAVKQNDDLAAENVGLREERLARKNCVLNASSLDEAQQCVR